MKHFDIIIPARPYIKKFISEEIDTSPLILKLDKCHVSAIILESFKPSSEEVEVDNKEHKYLTDELRIRFSEKVSQLNRGYLSPYLVLTIDHRLKAMFDQQLCAFVTMTNDKIGDIQVSIFRFMEHYNISEDDLALDTVLKMYYRARYDAPSKKKAKMDKVVNDQLNLFQ